MRHANPFACHATKHMRLPVDTPEELHRAAALIRDCDGLIIAAGAGMGIDSGLPDFRGPQGFWAAYPALGAAGLRFEDIADPAMFTRNPRLAWGFYGHRLALYRQTTPHEGFEILRQMGSLRPRGLAVFTSNVDGQFQKAGFTEVMECHGSIHWLQCSRPCRGEIWPATDISPVVDTASCELLSEIPVCIHCGAVARPNILMFNDMGWVQERAAQQETRLGAWLQQLEQPVVVEVGAGSAVASVRAFSSHVIRRHGGRLIRINPREPDVRRSQDVAWPIGALQACHALRSLHAE